MNHLFSRSAILRVTLLLGMSLGGALGLQGCGKDAPPPKVLVIGLDGATFDLIGPWMEAGKLPNLRALRDEGASGTLFSVIPPWSPPAWTTAVTGVNPGQHGIYDFFRVDYDSLYGLTETAASRRVPAIWTLLSEADRKVGVINVPMSDPPDPVNGFMISGLPHPDTLGFATPGALEDDLHHHGYLLDRMGEALVPGHEADLETEIFETFRSRRATALRLGEQNPDLDLYWVVFTGTDRVQHFFWKFFEKGHPYHDPDLAPRFGDTMLRLWQEVDGAVGDLVTQARAQAEAQGRELAVLVVSDHGFGPVHRAFRVQSFLRQPPDGREPITSTYSLEFNASLLYVPVRGREANGVMTPEEQGEVAGEVLDRVMNAVDPVTGVKPARFGGRREDVYRGRYLSKAPDLVFLAEPPYYLINEPGNQEPFASPDFSFNAHHQMNGILIAAGPMFRRGAIEGRQSLLDLTPTVMHLSGVPIPGYMEGRALSDLLTADYQAGHPVVIDDREARQTGTENGERIKAIPYLN
jgi:predicted AlkP superfamily phosphohydrolase/phosphomutase